MIMTQDQKISGISQTFGFTMNQNSKYQRFFSKCILAVILCMWIANLIWNSFPAHRIREVVNNNSCGCLRRPFYSGGEDGKRLNSTCSDPGTFYEPRQNVVSFCLHLDRPVDPKLRTEFVPGIPLNLKRMRKFYPTFSMRLYTDEELTNGSEYCKLWCENPDLFWCDVRRSPSLGNMSNVFYTLWRFATLGDPTVETFLSRDLDSFINFREATAVQEWFKSAKTFHAMRDHHRHISVVLAGMWGARNSLLLRNEGIELRERLFQPQFPQSNMDGLDERMLDYVLRSKSKDFLVHDSYYCSAYGSFGQVRPFPTKRGKSTHDHVASIIFNPEGYNLTNASYEGVRPCPVECRPSYGKDWEYC